MQAAKHTILVKLSGALVIALQVGVHNVKWFPTDWLKNIIILKHIQDNTKEKLTLEEKLTKKPHISQFL